MACNLQKERSQVHAVLLPSNLRDEGKDAIFAQQDALGVQGLNAGRRRMQRAIDLAPSIPACHAV